MCRAARRRRVAGDASFPAARLSRDPHPPLPPFSQGASRVYEETARRRAPLERTDVGPLRLAEGRTALRGGLTEEATTERMLDALGADAPLPQYSAHLMLHGRFVGAWEGTVDVCRRDGTWREESCEVYFGWVLEGRAVHDVWIAPARRDRADADRDATKDMYGTTIRVCDPDNDVWLITWIEPGTQAHGRMTGERQGDDIVQEYRDEVGTRWQWCSTEITSESFHWIARASQDDGTSWQVRNEFFMKRRTSR